MYQPEFSRAHTCTLRMLHLHPPCVRMLQHAICTCLLMIFAYIIINAQRMCTRVIIVILFLCLFESTYSTACVRCVYNKVCLPANCLPNSKDLQLRIFAKILFLTLFFVLAQRSQPSLRSQYRKLEVHSLWRCNYIYIATGHSTNMALSNESPPP